jgi:DNA-binding transcriptional LysR family regulator
MVMTEQGASRAGGGGSSQISAQTLDVRRLRVLREVAERGSISAAADALFCTPSAVSRQVSALEREVGLTLVERRGRSVAVTDAGLVLVEHSAAVFRAIEAAATAVQMAAGAVAGAFHVSSFTSAATAFVVPALLALETDHPGLDIHFIEADADYALRELRLGRHELVIAQEYRHVPEEQLAGLVTHPLFEDDLQIVVPDTPEYADRTTLADLADARWILPGAEETACGEAVMHTCHHAGFAPTVRARVDDFALTLQLVAKGFGAAIMPWLGAPQPVPGVRLIPIREPGFARVTSAAVRPASSRSPAIAAAHDHLRVAAKGAQGLGGRVIS